MLVDVVGGGLEILLFTDETEKTLLPRRTLLGEDIAVNEITTRRFSIEFTLLLGGLALADVLSSALLELGNTTFEPGTLGISLLPNFLDVLALASQPNTPYTTLRVAGGTSVLSSVRLTREGVGKCKKIGARAVTSTDTRDDTSELLDASGRVDTVRDVGDGNGPSARKRQVLRSGQPSLSNIDKVIVLSPDQVDGPAHQDDSDEEMGNMPDLIGCTNVAESQYVKAVVSLVRRNSRNRNKDSASEDYVGDKHLKTKDLEVADVKVGIGTIGDNDVLVRCFEQRFPKRYYTRREGLRSFARRGKDCPGLENPLQIFPPVENEPERGETSDRDTCHDKRRDEG